VVDWSNIAKDSVALDENLVDIDYKSSGVSEGISLVDPFIHCSTVFEVVAAGTEISRAEDFSLCFNGKMVVGDDPFAIDVGQFLDLVLGLVVVDSGGSGAEYWNNGVDLGSEFVSN
jgi:hypothetical protein